MMTERDYISALNFVKKEGREEGREEERISIAKGLLAAGISAEVISRTTGLSTQELQKL